MAGTLDSEMRTARAEIVRLETDLRRREMLVDDEQLPSALTIPIRRSLAMTTGRLVALEYLVAEVGPRRDDVREECERRGISRETPGARESLMPALSEEALRAAELANMVAAAHGPTMRA